MEPKSETPLPPLYARWVEQVLGTSVPAETRATCLDCVMCASSVASDAAVFERFVPPVKCCTYVPQIWNFLVGHALGADRTGASHGPQQLRAQIRDRIGATPVAISPSRRSVSGYRAVTRVEGFGTSADLVCPYSDPMTGGCGVWQARNSVCSTWFCRHIRGAVGFRFWNVVRDFLAAVERELADWCVVKLGLSGSAVDELYGPDGEVRYLGAGDLRGCVEPDGVIERDFYRALWANWYGKEEEFYLASADMTGSLSWGDVRGIGGPKLAMAERRLIEAHASYNSNAIPERLVRAQIRDTPGPDGALFVQCDEAPYDPQLMEADLRTALDRFDGRPRQEVVVEIGGLGGPALADETLRALYEAGLLIAVDGKDIPPMSRSIGPVQPDDRLSFFRGFQGQNVSLVQGLDEGGLETVTLQCHPNRVCFDDPHLFEFARKLVSFQNGFTAKEALDWGPTGRPYTWEKVSELFQALLEGGMLQRLP